MSKILVVYFSKTGNTEKMAKLIEEGAKRAGAEVSLKSVDKVEASELLDYDGIIMGSPCYYGGMAAELKRLIDDSVEFHGKLVGKVGAAFCSSFNIGGGNETVILNILHAFMIHGMVVQGIIGGDHYGPVAIAAPDKRATGQCISLGKQVADLVEKITKQ